MRVHLCITRISLEVLYEAGLLWYALTVGKTAYHERGLKPQLVFCSPLANAPPSLSEESRAIAISLAPSSLPSFARLSPQ